MHNYILNRIFDYQIKTLNEDQRKLLVLNFKYQLECKNAIFGTFSEYSLLPSTDVWFLLDFTCCFSGNAPTSPNSCALSAVNRFASSMDFCSTLAPNAGSSSGSDFFRDDEDFDAKCEAKKRCFFFSALAVFFRSASNSSASLRCVVVNWKAGIPPDL